MINRCLLIQHKNICCDPSSEPSHKDGSDERSQHMVSKRNKQNYPSVIIKYTLLSRALWDVKLPYSSKQSKLLQLA